MPLTNGLGRTLKDDVSLPADGSGKKNPTMLTSGVKKPPAEKMLVACKSDFAVVLKGAPMGNQNAAGPHKGYSGGKASSGNLTSGLKEAQAALGNRLGKELQDHTENFVSSGRGGEKYSRAWSKFQDSVYDHVPMDDAKAHKAEGVMESLFHSAWVKNGYDAHYKK